MRAQEEIQGSRTGSGSSFGGSAEHFRQRMRPLTQPRKVKETVLGCRGLHACLSFLVCEWMFIENYAHVSMYVCVGGREGYGSVLESIHSCTMYVNVREYRCM